MITIMSPPDALVTLRHYRLRCLPGFRSDLDRPAP